METLANEITISQREYDQLVKDSETLQALEQCGVDNWCGYDEALALMREWAEEDDQ